MRYNKINLMLPTYKRVSNGKLPRFINSVLKYKSNLNNICFTFLVNEFDEETLSFVNTFRKNNNIYQSHTLIENSNTPHLGKFYNQIYKETIFKEPGTVVSMVGDDMEFKTSGYDLAILNVINKHNGNVIVYCNDDYVQGKKLCVNLFTTRKLIESTKHPFMCELFAAYYIDTVWMKVGQKMNLLHYLNNVIIKHHHMSSNKKLIDETAQRLQKVKIPFGKGYKEVDKYVNSIIKNLKRI